ncbi:MAG: hypothetical protein HY645_15250 [Acidobacteria bacterium]|nr:hypothetical protein [Acidobacteriota bacterium]
MSLRSRPNLLLLCVVVFSSIPFLNQAFHIDDRIYLEIAENIIRRPLYPYDYAPVFEGLKSPDAASHSHLPLTSYYLAAVKTLSSARQEWVYHTAFLVFPWLAALGFYDLARRLTRFPMLATLLLIFSPGFFVLSHTLMTEIPLLALWVFTFSRFVRIVLGEATRRDWIFCGLGLAGAAFISVLSAGLLLLMLAFFLKVRSTGHSNFPATASRLFLIPIAIWVLWFAFSSWHYDRFVLVNTLRHLTKRGGLQEMVWTQNTFSFLLNVGGVISFPLFAWICFAGAISARLMILLLMLVPIPFYVSVPGWNWMEIFLVGAFLSSGLLTMCGVWRALPPVELRRAGDLSQVLKLWFSGIFISCLILYYSGSVRYSLLAFPPAILLGVMGLERRASRRFTRSILILLLTLTVPYAMLLAHADYEFAGIYRELDRQLVQDYRNRPETAGKRIWFTGEWGFRYYLELQGATLLTRNGTEPQAGDLIVKPYIATPWITLYDGPQYSSLLEQRPARAGSPLRLLDFSTHAGFYSTGWGILPFSLSLSDKPWEWVNVFQVKKEYRGPVPEEEKHW